MMQIASEQALLECFRELDRPEVEIPRTLGFPLSLEDCYAWLEPSGARIYLVFVDSAEDGERRLPKGIVFRRGPAQSPPMMCEWCHSVRAGDGVGLLTATSNDRRRVGLHLCRDLSCKEKIHSAPGVHDLQETLTDKQRTDRLFQRMSDLARRHLF